MESKCFCITDLARNRCMNSGHNNSCKLEHPKVIQRNEIVNLRDLKEGDRFVFLKSDVVWQVMGHLGSSTAVNRVFENGNKLLKHDELKRGSTQVKYLRSTKTI